MKNLRCTNIGKGMRGNMWSVMMNECLSKRVKMALYDNMLLPVHYMEVRAGYIKKNIKTN